MISNAPPELTPEQQRASTAAEGSTYFRPSDCSVIGSDLSIEGQAITIRCRATLRVNGHIQADHHCRELLIGEQAMLVGTIAAEKIAVSGRVNGAIFGHSVVLHATAQVEGDISSRSLSVENGARFDGRSRKLADSDEVAFE